NFAGRRVLYAGSPDVSAVRDPLRDLHHIHPRRIDSLPAVASAQIAGARRRTPRTIWCDDDGSTTFLIGHDRPEVAVNWLKTVPGRSGFFDRGCTTGAIVHVPL
ncbi:DUF1214 domain-containing protein, partial [Oerskovia merdavium]|uniref:DUF1214 domain-containing protein n=1 Tax=Oerskovia merdavium TaxID=2762227 RepID=UPI001CD8811F